jgi:hypothetical protein
MPNATFYEDIIPVVTRTIGESFKNATTTLRSLGGYQTIYEAYISRQFIEGITKSTPVTLQDIVIDINREILAWKRSRTTLSYYIEGEAVQSRRGNSPLTIKDIYGVFIIMLIGYIASVLFRIFFTKKKGLDRLILCKNCFRKEVTVTDSPDFEFKVEDIVIENKVMDIKPVGDEIELTEVTSVEIEVSDFDIESVASK